MQKPSVALPWPRFLRIRARTFAVAAVFTLSLWYIASGVLYAPEQLTSQDIARQYPLVWEHIGSSNKTGGGEKTVYPQKPLLIHFLSMVYSSNMARLSRAAENHSGSSQTCQPGCSVQIRETTALFENSINCSPDLQNNRYPNMESSDAPFCGEVAEIRHPAR